MSNPAGNNRSQGAPADRLAPLPRRTLDGESGDGEIRTASPTATVAELLERTHQLLLQLEADIDALRHDQERDRTRIIADADRREREAEAAIARLQELAARARTLSERKAVTDVFDAALATAMTIDPSISFDQLVRRIEQEVRLAKGITGAIRLAGIGQLLKQATLHVERMAGDAREARAGLLRETEHELESEGNEARASYEIGMGVVVRDLRILDLALPPSGLPWEDDRWNRWERWDPLSGASRWIRFGSFFRTPIERLRFPALIELPGERPLAIDVATGPRDQAVGAVRSILGRLLASTRGGDVLLSFIDPVALGDSAAPFLPLGEHREDLIGGKVHTTEDEIEELLGETSRHIETVIQQYLSGGFESLDAASETAGELLEPYRMLAIFDFPNHFTPRALDLVRNIAENGPRCGVFLVATTAAGAARANGSRWRSLLAPFDVVTGTPDGYRFDAGRAGVWHVDLDQPGDLPLYEPTGEPTLFGRIIATTGTDARHGRIVEVSHPRTFELLTAATRARTRDDLPDLTHDVVPDDPSTWWAGDATRGIGAPIGRITNREVATLWLDSGDHPGVIIGGEEGSGSTTLLHNLVVGLAMLYSPDEVALHLLDCNPGHSSFDGYATESLPHARVVAIDADREFGVSVLDDLAQEMARRAEIIAPHGGERTGIEGYRRSTGQPLPRIVLVLDGAEHLFGVDDRVTDEATQLLDLLARQGPSAGIHLVLATHDMARLQRLGRHTTDQIPGRIAFACPDDESRRILGGDGSASRLEHVGEALSRQLDGPPGTLRPVHTVALGTRKRNLILRDLRRRAWQDGIDRRPQVFEGDAPARIEDRTRPSEPDGTGPPPARPAPRLWLGEPVALGPAVEVTLRPRTGANLLVVGASTALTHGLTFAALVGAARSRRDDIDVAVVDFSPLETGFTQACALLGHHLPVSVHRRHEIGDLLARTHALVTERTAASDFGAAPVVLVLNGIGTAFELDLTLTRDPGRRDAVSDPTQLLEAITRDGPTVGVHVIVSGDTARAVTERMARSTLRRFGLRVVLALPASDSLMLIDSSAATSLRSHQALLYDEAAGQLTKLRPYLLPHPAAIERLGQAPQDPGTTEGDDGASPTDAYEDDTRLEQSSNTTPSGWPTSALTPNPR